MVKLKYNFDIEPYITQLVGKKIHIKSLADVQKVYVSREYSRFITDLYTFFNDNREVYDANLSIRLNINYFWTSILGPNLIDKYKL